MGTTGSGFPVVEINGQTAGAGRNIQPNAIPVYISRPGSLPGAATGFTEVHGAMNPAPITIALGAGTALSCFQLSFNNASGTVQTVTLFDGAVAKWSQVLPTAGSGGVTILPCIILPVPYRPSSTLTLSAAVTTITVNGMFYFI